MSYYSFTDLMKDNFYIRFEQYIKNTLCLPIDYKTKFIGFGKFGSFFMFWIRQNKNNVYEFCSRLKYTKSTQNNLVIIEFSSDNSEKIKNTIENIYKDFKSQQQLLKDVDNVVINNSNIINSYENYDLINQLDNCLNELNNYFQKNTEPIYLFECTKLISRRLFNALNNAKITNFQDLCKLTALQIYKIKNLGSKSIIELISFINAYLINKSNITLIKNNIKLEHEEQKILFEITKTATIEALSKEKIEDFQSLSIEIIDNYIEACNVVLSGQMLDVFNLIALSNNYQTLQNIGDDAGLTRERIRQILVKISKKIKSVVRKFENIQFCRIVEKLNKFTIHEFLSFILYGIYLNNSTKLTECFLSSFYSLETTKQILTLCNKTLKHIGRIDRSRDFISENVTFINNPLINKPKIKNFEQGEKELPYKYLQDTYDVLNKLPEVKKIVINPNIVYYISQTTSHKPNFAIELIDGNIILILVLPTLNLSYSYNIKRFNQLHLYCKENNLGYIIINDKLKSIQNIKNMQLNSEIENCFNNIMNKKNYIGWIDLKEVKNKYKITDEIIVSYVLKNKLKFTPKPFLIQR